MPKWGLTKDLIDHRPWSLDPSVLVADKTITNSIQQDVYVNHLERLFIDSPPMQRLRRVKQLGTTHLVYPDATHTRFSHALGTLRAAQDLLDAVLDQENRPRPPYDLFREWRESLTRKENGKRLAETIVLTRLGALLHDLCHIPFGHTIEDDLDLLEKHDRNADRFDRVWADLPPEVRKHVSSQLKTELRLLILSKEKRKGLPRSKYPFVGDLVGNTICADLLDYLRRDHQNLGLPLALGHRFLEGLYVTPSDHPHYKERVAIEVVKDGEERADVITELLKVLRYRYEESERALVHHAKLAPDAMIGKLLAMWRDALWVDEASNAFGTLQIEHRKDVDLLRAWIETRGDDELRSALANLESPEPNPDISLAENLNDRIEKRVRPRLETAFLSHGDEGLLERLARLDESSDTGQDTRRAAIRSLAIAVRDRKLYKRIGRSLPGDQPLAESIWMQHGDPDARRRLEVEVAEIVGLQEKWHLVLWIPSLQMRLKLAFVLVGGGDHVTTLHAYRPQVQEIYDSHERLWSVGVYVHPSVRDDELRSDAILAVLRKKLGLRGWVNNLSQETLEQVAARHFVSQHDLTESVRQKLLAGVSALGPSDSQTLEGIWERLTTLKDSMNN
jgi:HD superfamily phosphohydrolase